MFFSHHTAAAQAPTAVPPCLISGYPQFGFSLGRTATDLRLRPGPAKQRERLLLASQTSGLYHRDKGSLNLGTELLRIHKTSRATKWQPMEC